MLHHRPNELKHDGYYRHLGHHFGMTTLKQSAMEKCYICLPLWQTLLDINQEYLRPFYQVQESSTSKMENDYGWSPAYDWLTMGILYLEPGNSKFWVVFSRVLCVDLVNAAFYFDLKSPGNMTCLLLYVPNSLTLPDTMPTISVESSTMSKSSLNCASRWLHQCLSSHEQCVGNIEKSSWYPTRLLHVENYTDSIKRIRLIHSAREQPQGPYLTLSHRWGESETLKLTRGNIGTFARAIDISSLPKKFSDALRVTVALGCQYLWIDSLCIIQDEDDLSDWSHEAGLMHKVYLHSRCNISASVSKGSEEPLSRDRDPKSFYGHVVTVPVDGSEPGSVYKDFWLERIHIWTDNIPRCHLNTRGWVFQERVLAPRVLHFCDDQLFWECRSHRACERYPLGLDEIDSDFNESGYREGETSLSILKGLLEKNNIERGPGTNEVESGISFWMKVMTAYSSTILSFPTDRLIALSGIAKQMSALFQDIYVAGMWRKTLPYDLLWLTSPPLRRPDDVSIITPHRSRGYTAPSWSWASVNCPIIIWNATWESFLFDILDFRLQNATDDVTGRLIGGWMTLRVQLIPLSLWYDQVNKEWNATLSSVESAVSTFSLQLDEIETDPCHFHDDNVNRRLFYIPMAYCRDDGEESVTMLFLRTSDDEAGVFTRFGLAWGVDRGTLPELDEDEKRKFPSLGYQDGKHIIRVI